MNWFQRTKDGLSEDTEKKELPNVWRKCDSCGEILYKKDLEKNRHVCLKCRNHFRIFAKTYLQIIMDPKTFKPIDKDMIAVDPLQFTDTKKYSDRIKTTISKTGLRDAIHTGYGKIHGRPIAIAVMDFGFIGGSMGSVVGEKISRITDGALKHKLPLIIVSASGGARMMEGALSLMQMAKTSAKLALMHEAGLPFISLLTDPTTGGVTASFAMLGDVILAEPGALIGFAGPRVVKEATGKDLPEGFQRAEFLVEHGFVDLIVNRNELKDTLSRLLMFFENNTNVNFDIGQINSN
jgi:acetyl-CoA carboxylase carboxyl transferase subunit beta